MSQQGKQGCGSTFFGCFTAGLLLLLLLGAAAYVYIPKVLENVDRNLLPWLQSKGRVVLGKMSLRPLIKTIERSELSREEKKAWNDFLMEKWEGARSFEDGHLLLELLINRSRDVVGSYSGMYYALLAIGDRDFHDTSLTGRQIEVGQELITVTTANMLDGVYSLVELEVLKPNLFSVLSGWRVETQNAQGRREEDNNIRNFFRDLLRLKEQTQHSGDNIPRDMHAEFRKELESLKQSILQAEQQMRETSVPRIGGASPP